MNDKNRMLIDAAHPEETRVVVLRDGRVEEFDHESEFKRPLRGNIYLAKVTRVEPSLQAAFVDYGGNRHGFLAFSEIHPDYYQIPMADRQALLAEVERAHASEAEQADEDERPRRGGRRRNGRDTAKASEGETTKGRKSRWRRGRGRRSRESQDGERTGERPASVEPWMEIVDVLTGETVSSGGTTSLEAGAEVQAATAAGATGGETADEASAQVPSGGDSEDIDSERRNTVRAEDIGLNGRSHVLSDEDSIDDDDDDEPNASLEVHASDEFDSDEDDEEDDDNFGDDDDDDGDDEGDDEPVERVRGAGLVEDQGVDELTDDTEDDSIESVGSEDALEEVPIRRRDLRRYKIQEVIKRRQVILVQVVKEERGTKGAALTTYLSLAGRYTVLMPNTARGGGISRKITNASDRKRLREAADSLEVPKGMGLIIRTAGASRTTQDVRRDYDYLLRLWENVRELTLRSKAPCLVYEEGNLIKRSIRDLYSKHIDEVLVAGEDAYEEAHAFMRMISPEQADTVRHYRNADPLFSRFKIERQLNAMFSPFVTLPSGGYIVINQTEALVAVDVNSGKSTREHSIEETAYATNLEAAEEIARQLKLRDLAGLIVIDFIDMEERRNNRNVERRLKDCLKNDRARIQVGRISPFGLLEMSRQRLRTGVLEGSTTQCPHCQGSGVIRSTESVSLAVLRSLEDTLLSGNAKSLNAITSMDVALYMLNHKRPFIQDIEKRYSVTVTVTASEKMHGAQFNIEEVQVTEDESDRSARTVVKMDWGFETAEAGGAERDEENSRRKGRRRRKRGGRDSDLEMDRDSDRDDDTAGAQIADDADEDDNPAEASANATEDVTGGRKDTADGEGRRGRKRGRRGGRRNRQRSSERRDAEAGDNDEQERDDESSLAESSAEGLTDDAHIASASTSGAGHNGSDAGDEQLGDTQYATSENDGPSRRRSRPRRQRGGRDEARSPRTPRSDDKDARGASEHSESGAMAFAEAEARPGATSGDGAEKSESERAAVPASTSAESKGNAAPPAGEGEAPASQRTGWWQRRFFS